MTDHCGPGRRKTQAGRRSDPEEMLAKVQAAAEEMTMRRYVHTVSYTHLTLPTN